MKKRVLDAMIGRGDVEVEEREQSGQTTAIREEVDVAVIGKR